MALRGAGHSPAAYVSGTKRVLRLACVLGYRCLMALPLLTTSVSCEILTALSGTDAKSRQVPDGAFMGRLDLTLTSIVTAATVTVWLAKSSTGEDAITDQVAATIVDDDADGNGSVSVLVGSGWVDDGVAGTQPYVCAKTDAGTATSIGRLIFEVR